MVEAALGLVALLLAGESAGRISLGLILLFEASLRIRVGTVAGFAAVLLWVGGLKICLFLLAEALDVGFD